MKIELKYHSSMFRSPANVFFCTAQETLEYKKARANEVSLFTLAFLYGSGTLSLEKKTNFNQ